MAHPYVQTFLGILPYGSSQTQQCRLYILNHIFHQQLQIEPTVTNY